MRWINGKKTELLPPIDNDDFPKQYTCRVYGDDPHSGCVAVFNATAEEMRKVNEDGYWEWLDESESSSPSHNDIVQEMEVWKNRLDEDRETELEDGILHCLETFIPKLKQIGEAEDFEVLRKEEEFRVLSKHNKAIINDLKEQRKQLHEKDEEIKHLKEGLEWIRKELSLSFPYHEYADNKPACEMALTINHVREYIVFEVLSNEGATEGAKQIGEGSESYWKKRCLAAERCLEVSPCDPDITKEQIKAHAEWQQLKLNENL